MRETGREGQTTLSILVIFPQVGTDLSAAGKTGFYWEGTLDVVHKIYNQDKKPSWT